VLEPAFNKALAVLLFEFEKVSGEGRREVEREEGGRRWIEWKEVERKVEEVEGEGRGGEEGGWEGGDFLKFLISRTSSQTAVK
jgi:hypothetical protein